MAESTSQLPLTGYSANILLVGQDPGNLLPLREILKLPCLNVVEAYSVQEALRRVQNDEFAAIILDADTQAFASVEVVERFRGCDNSRQTPVIICTAEDIDPQQLAAAYALGSVDFLATQLPPDVLMAKVQGFVKLFLDNHRAAAEASQLRLIVQGTIDYAIIMIAPDGRVVTWNRGAELLKGYKEGEIIGDNFTRFYPQEAIDRGWPAHELTVAREVGRFEDEGWRVRKDGTQFWANVVITSLYNQQGELCGFSTVTRDLTERKRAEEELRRSEERFRLLVEGALDHAIFLLDPQGYVESWNTGAERIKQFKADEIIGQHFSTFYPQESLDRGWPEHELKVALREGRFEDEGWRIRKDGSQFWANVIITALKDETGELLGFSKITRDMTDRKIAEENALRLAEEAAARKVADEERELLQVTLASIGDGVITTDAHGLVTFLNPVAEILVGLSTREAVGRPLEQVFCIVNEYTRQRVENPAIRAIKEGTIVGLANHTILISKDGTETPIDDSAAPVRDVRGQVVGSVLVFRDISERKRIEKVQKESHQQIVTTLESISDGFMQFDREWRIMYINAEAERLNQRPREAILDRIYWELFPDIVGTRLEAEFQRALADRVTVELENYYEPWDQWFSIKCYPSADGCLAIYFRDITDHKKAEDAVRRTEEQLRNITDTVPALIGYVDTDCRYQLNNRAYELWFGRERSQITGRYVREVLGDTAWAVVGPNIEMALSGQTANYEAQVYYNHAGLRWIEATYVPSLTSTGEIAGVVVLVNDITERKEQEAALRESEEKLRLLADTIPQLAWMANSNGDIFWYNRRWYEYTGTTSQEVEGWGWQRVYDPDVLPEVLVRWRASIASGEPFDMVIPIKGVSGKFRPFLTRVNPLVGESGEILYWFGTSTDIAELREAREALAVSEERLRLALDAGRMGVWDWNVRTGSLKWSDSLEPLHGLAPGTFGGTFEHFVQLIHPEDLSMVMAAIQKALDSAGEFYVEFRNIWQNGGIHWIAGSGKVFADDDGQPLRMIGIGMDVTQRKRAEQTSRFLADASAALAVLVDFDSTLQKVSSLAVPAFADWATVDLVEPDGSLRRVSVSHIDPEKVQLAREVHRRFPPNPDASHGTWNILSTGRSEIVSEITDELLVKSISDGELLSITRQLGLKSYIGVPLTVRGRTIGVITFINAESGHHYDYTDLNVAEDLAHRAAIAIENAQLYRELRDADQRKDEFLATLAHELRNPLAPIRNGLEVMRLAGDDGEMALEARSMMERQVNQMVRLVDDLLDVSRITRNKLELRKERITLATVINSAVETSLPLMQQAQHEFSLTLPPTTIYLHADATRLAQVFSNLLNNAAKYSEPGGQISLTGCLANDDEIEVQVRDNGLGIPAEALPKIFQMFSQIDDHVERAQGGLGIGLTLVKSLVEMHGGTVEAYSDGPGHGSKFIVRLPIIKMTDISTEIPSNLVASTATKWRILIVDDNKDAATSMKLMLELLGHETCVVHDGVAAVETAEKLCPDKILLDLGLPKLNGYETCRRIKDQAWSNGIEIIALTGWGQQEDRRRTKEAGFDYHLVKPVELVSLQKLLEGHATKSTSQQHQTMYGASLRVLVVDDRRDATLMLKRLLTADGYDVRVASDGPEGLAAAIEHQPDVVFLDISLPGMSGLEVARQIRQHPALDSIMLIAMTGYGDESHRQRSFEAGFDHHLVKPADIKMVRKILSTVHSKSK